MTFLEKDLEEIVFETSLNSLKDRGLDILQNAHTYRQLSIGNYGVADIVQFRKMYKEEGDYKDEVIPYIEVSVFELKKDLIGLDTFMQAIRYCRGLLSFIGNRSEGVLVSFNIILIGKKVELQNSFGYLKQIINSEEFNLSLYTYDYKYDGIYFNEVADYGLIDEGINDRIKYLKYKKTESRIYRRAIDGEIEF